MCEIAALLKLGVVGVIGSCCQEFSGVLGQKALGLSLWAAGAAAWTKGPFGEGPFQPPSVRRLLPCASLTKPSLGGSSLT